MGMSLYLVQKSMVFELKLDSDIECVLCPYLEDTDPCADWLIPWYVAHTMHYSGQLVVCLNFLIIIIDLHKLELGQKKLFMYL